MAPSCAFDTRRLTSIETLTVCDCVAWREWLLQMEIHCITLPRFPRGRTQHNVVGLLPGELGVPHHLLPASCCLLPDGGAPPAAVHGGQPDGTSSAEAAGGRESALFVTRDGGMGIIQARAT